MRISAVLKSLEGNITDWKCSHSINMLINNQNNNNNDTIRVLVDCSRVEINGIKLMLNWREKRLLKKALNVFFNRRLALSLKKTFCEKVLKEKK